MLQVSIDYGMCRIASVCSFFIAKPAQRPSILSATLERISIDWLFTENCTDVAIELWLQVFCNVHISWNCSNWVNQEFICALGDKWTPDIVFIFLWSFKCVWLSATQRTHAHTNRRFNSAYCSMKLNKHDRLFCQRANPFRYIVYRIDGSRNLVRCVLIVH